MAELIVAADVLPVRCHSQSLTNGRMRAEKRYTAEMIEWLAVYDATTDAVLYVPAAELGPGKCLIHLRLGPARNNQQARIRLADDYRTPTIRPEGP